MFGRLPFGNGGALGMNVGTAPDVGVDAKLGVGAAGSAGPI
jgi:hypothetical protein